MSEKKALDSGKGGKYASNDTMPSKARKERGNIMYIGPTIPGIVRESTVFLDGVLPRPLVALVTENGFIKKLLVPVNGLREAALELQDKGSSLSALYNRARHIEGGKYVL